MIKENTKYETPEAKSIKDRSGIFLVKTKTPRTAIHPINAETKRAGTTIHEPIIRKQVPRGGDAYKIAPNETPAAKLQIKACR